MSADAEVSDDPFDQILDRENNSEDNMKKVAERDDRIGAAARVVLPLAHEEDPDSGDLKIIGLIRTQDGKFVYIGVDEA